MPCGRIVPPPQIEGLLTTTGWSNPGERQHPADLPLGGDDDHSSPRILHHHTSWVLTLAFSPDGTTLANGSVDCTICLWDVASGSLRAVLTGHTETVTGVAFSPDGSTVFSCGYDGTIKACDVQTGVCVNTIGSKAPIPG